MNYDSEELERDRKLEMQQDSYDERMELDKVQRLYEEPESIQEWNEWQEFSLALEDFKKFCRRYDLDWKQELKEM